MPIPPHLRTHMAISSRTARLPRSLEDLDGLRAARWIRESTRGQYDNYGPEAQREQQDRAIARWSLADAGIEWQVAHSGRTVGSTAQFREMVARAGRDYDVLLVGYVSRFTRNLHTAVTARAEIHAAGAAILFCDERVLSSDEDEWESWARETVEAEAYSRRLGKRIREGYAAKFRRLADPGGHAPLGFRRTAERPQTLEVDPASIGRAVNLFERYASGAVSIDELARGQGMNDRTLNDILKNPVYNGWVVRKGERSPAAWRDEPPVDDGLWARVQELMARRTRGGGPRRREDPDPLRGLLRCVCGSAIRANGFTAGKRRRVHVTQPCPEGIRKKNWDTATWLVPLEAQLAGLRVDAAVEEAVIRAIRRPVEQVATDPADLEGRRGRLALDLATGRIGERAFLAAARRLREEEAAASAEPRVRSEVDAARALDYIRNFAAAWSRAKPATRSSMIQAVYQTVTVRGEEFVSVRLTDGAYAQGFAAALPQEVTVPAPRGRGRPPKRWALARPTGFEPATFGSGGRRSIH
jgi:DNA invertase Pin-like site-specific DNA recombinase